MSATHPTWTDFDDGDDRYSILHREKERHYDEYTLAWSGPNREEMTIEFTHVLTDGRVFVLERRRRWKGTDPKRDRKMKIEGGSVDGEARGWPDSEFHQWLADHAEAVDRRL